MSQRRGAQNARGLSPVDDTLEAFVTNSYERHAIAFGDWIARESNRRARGLGHGGLRPGHNRLFIHLDLAGSRVVDIAKAEGVSKNAIGQIVSELESLGYVERRADPEDRRAKRVHYTKKGIRLLVDARAISEGIAADVAAVMGPKKFAQLERLLGDAMDAVSSVEDGLASKG